MKKTLLSILLFMISFAVHAKDINGYLGEIRNFTAEFKQVVKNEQSGLREETSGEIIVQSPDSFRLTYTKPYKQVYVADGKVLWTYDEDLEQASVRKQENLIDSSPAAVLSNPANIDKAYQVKHIGDKEGTDVFYMTPKNPDSTYEYIELGFRDDALYSMRLFDELGQETMLTFSNLDYNSELDEGAFVFVVPEGVDIIQPR